MYFGALKISFPNRDRAFRPPPFENNTLLYDIAFIFDGKEIQPKEGSVLVTMEFKEQQLTETLSAQSESDVAVVHLPIKEEVKETTEITTTEEAKDISSSDIFPELSESKALKQISRLSFFKILSLFIAQVKNSL